MHSFINRENFWKILIITLVLLLPIFIVVGIRKMTGDKITDQPQPTPSSLPTTQQVTKVFLYCPSLVDYCSKGKDVIHNGVYLGYGAKITLGSPVKAAFNGKIDVATTNLRGASGIEKLTTITLHNQEAKTIAIYYFIGDGPQKDSLVSPAGYVKVGTTIGKITKDIPTYQTSLLFQMYKGDTPVSSQKLQLDSKSFLN